MGNGHAGSVRILPEYLVDALGQSDPMFGAHVGAPHVHVLFASNVGEIVDFRDPVQQFLYGQVLVVVAVVDVIGA